jgi:tRNA-Thr(GGU) m(6)t(6)A37 methyltransferase TsaA
MPRRWSVITGVAVLTDIHPGTSPPERKLWRSLSNISKTSRPKPGVWKSDSPSLRRPAERKTDERRQTLSISKGKEDNMTIEMEPIGFVSTDAKEIPRSWTVSDVEGALVINESYLEGLRDIQPGQRIYVIFHFHKSPNFTLRFMRVKRPIDEQELGVFSTHSPFRPNPIGLSLLEVLGIDGNVIRVKGLDMLDGTPILDIKPEVCP